MQNLELCISPLYLSIGEIAVMNMFLYGGEYGHLNTVIVFIYNFQISKEKLEKKIQG
jgi:hypothetical protein